MKNNITVSKCDYRGVETFRYPGRVLERDDGHIVIEARFGLEGRAVGGLFIDYGDRFVETYYAGRWYNLHAVYAADNDEFKGWYGNISYPPEFGRDLIAYRDLALDLVVSPSGEQTVLDEDEFEALDIPAADRRKALKALRELQNEFRTRFENEKSP